MFFFGIADEVFPDLGVDVGFGVFVGLGVFVGFAVGVGEGVGVPVGGGGTVAGTVAGGVAAFAGDEGKDRVNDSGLSLTGSATPSGALPCSAAAAEKGIGTLCRFMPHALPLDASTCAAR